MNGAPKFKMLHVTMTTPLSGMVCHSRAGTWWSTYIPTWSLYLCLLWRKEMRCKK